MERDQTFLIHIRDCIAAIRDYTSIEERAFMTSRLHQDAVMRNFEIIGEASSRLSPETKSSGKIAWSDVKAFRNLLAHQYMDVRPALVWRIVVDDHPALEAHILSLLEQ